VRAPDHGRLRPWRFMLIEGDQRQKFGEMLAASALRRVPGLSEGDLARERGKALRAPLIIVVSRFSRPAPPRRTSCWPCTRWAMPLHGRPAKLRTTPK
jgi:hypothetical protein